MSDEKTTNIAPELPPFDAGYRIGRQDGALYGLSAGSDAPDMITRRGEYYRAQLAPPERLPEDVAAMKGRLYQTFIDASACSLADGNLNWDAVARLVLSDRQRAVDAAYAAGVEDMRQTIIAENEEEARGGGPLCVEAGYWRNAKRYLLDVRARGAAREPLPEDVAYLGKRIVDLVRESVRKDVADGVGRIVQTFCQRAVDAAVAEEREACAMLAHKKLFEWHKSDRALQEYTNKGGAFLWNDVHEVIRARGAAQEKK